MNGQTPVKPYLYFSILIFDSFASRRLHEIFAAVFRVFGRVKVSVLLGFTLAAFNLDRIRSFRAKHGLEEGGAVRDVASDPSSRRKRRLGTWTQIVEERPQAPPAAPRL